MVLMTINIPGRGPYALTFTLPQVSRLRRITTLSLASFFTTLWIASPGFLPWAVVSLMHVTVGFVIPFGVGWVTLLLAERRVRKDLRTASEIAASDRHPSARLGAIRVRAAEREQRIVLEGEVVR